MATTGILDTVNPYKPWLNFNVFNSFIPNKNNEVVNVSIMEWIVLMQGIILGCIVSYIAGSKGRTFFWWWLYGFTFSIIALIHAILIKPNEQAMLDDGMKKCPLCAEMIKPDAKVCRYCGRDLPEEPHRELSPYERKYNQI